MSDAQKKPAYPPQGINAYKRTDVMTANKETILLMMYAGAIRFLKRAIAANDANDILERTKMVQRTQDIVSELRATLNFDVGGDLALSLESLYAYITDRLLQGNSQKSSEILNEALQLLITLNTAWEEAITTLKKERAVDAEKK